MHFEGIVSKRIGSRYVSGRTRGWLGEPRRATKTGAGLGAAVGMARSVFEACAPTNKPKKINQLR